MRGKLIAVAATDAVAIGLTLMLLLEATHAENAKSGTPADECWTGSDVIGGTACEHVFRDGSKCIVFSRNGAGSASLQCKIT